MNLLVIENQTKKGADFVLSPSTTAKGIYNSKGIIQYLTRKRIVARRIVNCLPILREECNNLSIKDGM